MEKINRLNKILLIIIFLLLIVSSTKYVYNEKPVPYYLPAYSPSENQLVLMDLHYFNHIPKYYRKVCLQINQELHIPFKIIYNLVLRESNWKWWAVGRNYDSHGKEISFDLGLCQLNSINFDAFYWKFNKFNTIYKVTKHDEASYKKYFTGTTMNLWTGFTYLRYLLDEMAQDYTKALYCYNWGIGNVKKGKVPPKKVVNYAKFILTN